jgi:hypothetical protein
MIRYHKVKTNGAKGRLGKNLQQYFVYWLQSISLADLTSSVKIYVATVEALKKKERLDETQFTTKIDGFHF